jgi:hypothetical protein
VAVLEVAVIENMGCAVDRSESSKDFGTGSDPLQGGCARVENNGFVAISLE